MWKQVPALVPIQSHRTLLFDNIRIGQGGVIHSSRAGSTWSVLHWRCGESPPPSWPHAMPRPCQAEWFDTTLVYGSWHAIVGYIHRVESQIVSCTSEHGVRSRRNTGCDNCPNAARPSPAAMSTSAGLGPPYHVPSRRMIDSRADRQSPGHDQAGNPHGAGPKDKQSGGRIGPLFARLTLWIALAQRKPRPRRGARAAHAIGCASRWCSRPPPFGGTRPT
jgi:hypothetical protein